MHSCYVLITCACVLNPWMNWHDELLSCLCYNNFVEMNGKSNKLSH